MHISDIMKMPEKDIYKLFPEKTFFKAGEYIINTNTLAIEEIKVRVKDKVFLETGKTNSINTMKLTPNLLLISHKTLPIIIDSYKKSLKIKKIDYVKKFIENILSKDQIKSDEYRIRQFDNNIIIDLYYKNLNITNSLGIEHIMQDFYVSYQLITTNGKLFLVNILINRGTLTVAEYMADYHFSHGNGLCTQPISLSNLCFGSDNPTSKIVNKAINGELNLIDLSHFLHTMYSYFTWESIEGTPFKHLQNLRNYRVELSSDSSIDSHSSQWKEIIHQTILNLDDDIEFDILLINQDEHKVTINSGLNSIYQKCIEIASKVLPKDHMNSILAHQHGDISGNFKPLSAAFIDIDKIKNINFHFGNEVITGKLDDTNIMTQKEIDDMYPRTLIEDIRLRIKRLIEQKLTEFLNLNYKKIENYD